MINVVIILIFVILRQPILSPDNVVIFSVCLREGVGGRGHEGVWRPWGRQSFRIKSSYYLAGGHNNQKPDAR